MKRIFILLLATIMVAFSLPAANTNGKVYADFYDGEYYPYSKEELISAIENGLESIWNGIDILFDFLASTSINQKTGHYDISLWAALMMYGNEAQIHSEELHGPISPEMLPLVGCFSNFEITLFTNNTITPEKQVKCNTVLDGNITAKTIDQNGESTGFAIVYNGNKNFRFDGDNMYKLETEIEIEDSEFVDGRDNVWIYSTRTEKVTMYMTKILTIHTKSDSVKISDMSVKAGYTTNKAVKELQHTSGAAISFFPGDFDRDGQFTVKDLITAQYNLADSIGHDELAYDEDTGMYYDSICLQYLKLYLTEEINFLEMFYNFFEYTQNIINPPCKHTETEWVIAVEPTCSDAGAFAEKCTSCGKFIGGTFETIPRLDHVKEYIIDKEPTCTQPGSESAYCSLCHDYMGYSRSIAATGHDDGKWETILEATCTTSGLQVRKCTKCGEKLEERIIETKEHIESDWIIDVLPTCIGSGARHKVCTLCHKGMHNEVMHALGHDDGKWETIIEPSYNKAGLKVLKCTRCDTKIAEEEIPATDNPRSSE